MTEMIGIKDGFGMTGVIIIATLAILGVIGLFIAIRMKLNKENVGGLVLICFLLIFPCLATFTLWGAGYFAPKGQPVEQKADEGESAKPAVEKLTEKLEKVAGLKRDIEKKRSEVNSLIADFVKGIDSLKTDINYRREAKGIRAFSQAVQDQQIKNNLSLMQRKLAYKERLQEIEDRLAAAHHDLEYMESKTNDDLKMSTVLSKEEMNRIVEQIESVLSKYAPETKELVINEADMKTRSEKNIWDSIASEPKSTTVRPESTTTVYHRHTTTVRPRPTTTVWTSASTTVSTTVHPEPTTTVSTTVYSTTSWPTTIYYQPTTVYPTTVLPLYPEPRVVYPHYPAPTRVYPIYPGPPMIYYPPPRVIRIYPGQPSHRYYRR